MHYNWLISPHSGTEETYTLTTTPYQGVYVANLDSTNSLTFEIPQLGELTLLPNQQYRDFFKVPFTSVEVTNPSGCKFIVARCE